MQSKLIKKIGLGTVQFGLDYGINNKTGKVSSDQVRKILDFAKQAGIDCLDTASLYGDSERILGQYFKNGNYRFKVVSKCKTVDGYSKDCVRTSLEESLKLLSLEKVYGYLIHRFDDYRKFPQLLNDFLELKQEGLIEKVGFSLYSLKELDFLLDNGVYFDLLQVPYSVFDRRFESYFKYLKKEGVEIHIRSLFLQGLAFMDQGSLPERLKDANPQLNVLNQISLSSGLSRSDICLNFGLMNSDVDQIIIGVDSLEQLKKNLSALDKYYHMASLPEQLNKVRINDEKILLPYHWS